MLNPIQLKYFVKVVESGSLNKAAKDLYISQPALTKQLTQLEKQVGHVLFLRKQKGIDMTEAGRFLYDKALFIINQLEILDRELEGFTKKTFLKIGALPSLATYYLPSILKNYEEKGYEASVMIRDTTQELIDMLKQEEINVGYIQDAANFTFDLPMENLFTVVLGINA